MSDHSSSSACDHGHDSHVHIVPMRILAGVFAALMILTFLTVAATWVDLGELNIVIALGVAVIKAAMVCLYFMHLRYDSPFNGMVLVVALLFVALFIGISLLDSHGYQTNVNAAVQTDPAAAK